MPGSRLRLGGRGPLASARTAARTRPAAVGRREHPEAAGCASADELCWIRRDVTRTVQPSSHTAGGGMAPELNERRSV